MVLAWLLFRTGGYKRQPLDVWFHPTSGERAYVRARPAAHSNA
jgi:hypothetical protein